MSPSGKLASKSIERYFHSQPSLESSSLPVYLIKLNFNLKFMNNNNKKMLEEKGRAQHCWHLILKSLSLCKGKDTGGCPLHGLEVHAGGDAMG